MLTITSLVNLLVGYLVIAVVIHWIKSHVLDILTFIRNMFMTESALSFFGSLTKSDGGESERNCWNETTKLSWGKSEDTWGPKGEVLLTARTIINLLLRVFTCFSLLIYKNIEPWSLFSRIITTHWWFFTCFSLVAESVHYKSNYGKLRKVWRICKSYTSLRKVSCLSFVLNQVDYKISLFCFFTLFNIFVFHEN